jgi:hypothetical protein
VDELDPVGLGPPGGKATPLVGHACRAGLFHDGVKIVLMDQVTIALALRAEPPSADPPPNGLWVASGALRRLKYAEHRRRLYYTLM